MTTPNLINDCFLHDKDRLRHHEAIDLLRSRLNVLVGQELIELSTATGRILAETIDAPRPIPLNDNSAVDGYAFNSSDFNAIGGQFPLSQRLTAGDDGLQTLAPQTAARIFTGAPMPPGADSVAMQEDCKLTEENGQPAVQIPSGLKPGANRRKAGEDLQTGDFVAGKGLVLNPQTIAAIASTGASKLNAFT